MKFTASQLALFTIWRWHALYVVSNDIQPKTFSINFFLPLCLFCLSLTRGNLKMMMVPLLQENVEKGLWNSWAFYFSQQSEQKIGTLTVVEKTNQKNPIFPSKMAFFKRVWRKVKVLSCPWAVGSNLPLNRPLKWGT